MTTPFQIVGLDHVVLRVADVGASLKFYCDVLGCMVEKVQAGLGLTQLRAGHHLIDLVDIAGPLGQMGGAAAGADARNMDHFCIRIEPWDEGALRSHLATNGVAIGDSGQRYGAEGTGPSIYVTDPDGNGVELKGPADSAN